MVDITNIQNSTVLVRVAFDLPTLQDTSRILDSLPTVKTLLTQNNKVILATKWGRPKQSDSELSTKNMLPVVQEKLQELVSQTDSPAEVIFLDQFSLGFEKVQEMIQQAPTKQIFLLENLHFDARETSKDIQQRLELANLYSTLANYYLDEAFPSSHRHEATNQEIKTILPWNYGLAYQAEIENLNKLKINPAEPFYVVMAGAKLETKLPLILNMIQKADKIFVGGLLSFTLISAAESLGWENLPQLHDSLVEVEFLDQAKDLLQKYPDKIVLPVDFVYSSEETSEGKKTYAKDCGEATVDLWQKELSRAKSLFWNGTLGQYELKPYDYSTLAIGSFVASLENCFKVLGGGDTGSSLPNEVLEKFDFVSMGGGATLTYLSK